ncbi:Heparinase II/III-like [hydrothermal vent metagenome]|uniref:Heparinase II/III-like n=1 Tax=hydrothermal vent metagenome TaxID=652676 RepID=A0A3B0RQD4_9ZZZZ
MSKPTLAQYGSSGLYHFRQAISDEFHAMPLYRALVFSGPAPLLRKPWPERPATPERRRGEDIASGLFQLAGKRLVFKNVEQAWSQATPSRAFAVALHEFRWLHDLANFEDDAQTAQLAREHVDIWIEKFGTWNRFAWNRTITAERCLSWLGSARFLFSGDAVSTSTRLICLGRQIRHLKSIISVCEQGDSRIWIALALTTAGTCLHGMEKYKNTGLDLLKTELKKQILPDGGHISRNPEIAARILSELETLSALLEQHDIYVPPFIRQTLDRLNPFIRFCLLPNGELAPFHGGGNGDSLATQQALSMDQITSKSFVLAPYSRYHRVQSARTTLLFDSGGAPVLSYASNANASALSFVFASQAGCLVTNCGWSAELAEKWRHPSRTSAAHSTLIIDDVSSSKLLDNSLHAKILGSALIDREEPITARRVEEDSGVWLNGSHQEYVSRYGLQYNRRLFLDKSGTDLRGEDTLERPIGMEKTTDLQPISFAIRFHLHPLVQASVSRDRKSVLLRLQTGEGWQFRCDQSQLALEPSVYLAAGAPPKRNSQIVLYGAADPNGTGQETSNRVRWSIRKIKASS